MKFVKCSHCGNILAYIEDRKVPVMCCGQKMGEIVANTQEAATEKHIPVVSVEGDCVKVCVGSVAHPSTEEHLIEWVALESKMGNQRKTLKAGAKPEVCFKLCEGDEVVSVYAYCNLHGLWKN